MQLTDAIAAFLQHGKNERTLAESSRKSFGWALRSFNAWIGADVTIHDMTPDKMRDYYNDILVAQKQYQPRSLHLHWAALTAVCKWLVSNSHLALSPMPDIKLPKAKKAVRKRLSESEAQALLKTCELQSDPYLRALHRVIVTVLVTTAIRHKELFLAQVADIKWDDCVIEIVHGKGDKTRRVPLGDQCIASLRAYLAVRPADTQHPYLLTHDCIRRVAYDHINLILKRIGYQAGFTEEQISRCICHACRRFCATRLSRNNVELDAIRVFLGHATLSTTQVYLDTSEERLHALRNLTNIPLEDADTPPDAPSALPPAADAPQQPKTPPVRDIAAPGQERRLSRRRSIRIPR